MVIETNNYFGELTPGECFFLADKSNDRLMMKTVKIFTEDGGYPLNAVSLSEGVFYSYNDDVEIIPISARVSL